MVRLFYLGGYMTYYYTVRHGTYYNPVTDRIKLGESIEEVFKDIGLIQGHLQIAIL